VGKQSVEKWLFSGVPLGKSVLQTQLGWRANAQSLWSFSTRSSQVITLEAFGPFGFGGRRLETLYQIGETADALRFLRRACPHPGGDFLIALESLPGRAASFSGGRH